MRNHLLMHIFAAFVLSLLLPIGGTPAQNDARGPNVVLHRESKSLPRSSGEFLGHKWHIDENHLLWWDGKPYIPFGGFGIEPGNKFGLKTYNLWIDFDPFIGRPEYTREQHQRDIAERLQRIANSGGTCIVQFSMALPHLPEGPHPGMRWEEPKGGIDASRLADPQVKQAIFRVWAEYAPAIRNECVRAVILWNEINVWRWPDHISIEEYAALLGEYVREVKHLVGNAPVCFKSVGTWNAQTVIAAAAAADGLGFDVWFEDAHDKRANSEIERARHMLEERQKKTTWFFIAEGGRRSNLPEEIPVDDYWDRWPPFRSKEEAAGILLAYARAGAKGFIYNGPSSDPRSKYHESYRWLGELKSEISHLMVESKTPLPFQGKRAGAANDKHIAANADAESLTGYITSVPSESSEDREARHKKIAERRAGPTVIVHRGAWAFAPENTLEAYAAAMDYGADGCEIDIRRTADGVLVMFHDDGLDRMTDALGPVNQYTYAELLEIEFRTGYRAKPGTRIPTLAAVLELARQRAMLLHLDVKEPGLEDDIAKLLDTADAWDHGVQINESNATELRRNPKAHCLAYKAFGWQEGRMDMNPVKVREGLAKPGDMIMVDDPRVAAHELKRKTLRVPLSDHLRASWSSNPAAAVASQSDVNSLSPAAYLRSLANRVDSRSLDELGKLLAADLPQPTDLEGDTAIQQQRARRILERAWAAKQIGQLGKKSTRAVRLLEELVAHRSLHPNWAYNGLDGAMAARALGVLGATESVPFLVQTLLAVDPELKKMVKPPTSYSYVWADYRMKREIICALGELPCEASRKFLREYVAMDEATAGKFAPPLFEEATRALLRQEITDEELQDLLRSTNSAVRGTAILVCLDDRTAGRTALLGKIVPWTRELP